MGVGPRKVDLITWNHEHIQMWSHLLSSEGTWIRGSAIAARKIQRRLLLAHWLDRRSINRYPDGTAAYGFLGTPVNVVHSVENLRLNPIAFAIHRENMQELPGPYYPQTRISKSPGNIDLNLWKQDGKNALGIIVTF